MKTPSTKRLSQNHLAKLYISIGLSRSNKGHCLMIAQLLSGKKLVGQQRNYFCLGLKRHSASRMPSSSLSSSFPGLHGMDARPMG